VYDTKEGIIISIWKILFLRYQQNNFWNM